MLLVEQKCPGESHGHAVHHTEGHNLLVEELAARVVATVLHIQCVAVPVWAAASSCS